MTPPRRSLCPPTARRGGRGPLLRQFTLQAGSPGKSDWWKQRVRRDGADGQALRLLFLPMLVPGPQRMNADASDIVATVNKVSTHDVALIHQHLGAEVADQPGTRTNGNQGICAGVFGPGIRAGSDLHHG